MQLVCKRFKEATAKAARARKPVEEWGEIQRDFATVFQGLLTNVQVGKIAK